MPKGRLRAQVEHVRFFGDKAHDEPPEKDGFSGFFSSQKFGNETWPEFFTLKTLNIIAGSTAHVSIQT